MKNHPYVWDASGEGAGSCVTCGQHFTHEAHHIPIEGVAPSEDPRGMGEIVNEARAQLAKVRGQLADFIAKVDVALGGEGTASPERVLEKARSLAAAHSFSNALKGRPLTPEEAAKPALIPEPLPARVDRAPNGDLVVSAQIALPVPIDHVDIAYVPPPDDEDA